MTQYKDTDMSNAVNTEKRLHPMSWLFIIIEFIKHFFVPLLVAFFAGGGDSYETLAAVFVIPGVLFAIIQYWVYRYTLAENEVMIREGVLIKNVRHVKYERIQNLNLTRNPLHRLFGVAQLELESASGGKPEAVMRVVSLTAVEEIKQKVLQAKAAVHHDDEETDEASDSEDERPPLLTIPLSELIKAGVISNKGMLVVAFAFGLLAQTRALDKFFDWLEVSMGGWFEGINFNMDHPLSIATMVVLGIIAFFIFIRLLSIIFMVFTYYGFELMRSGDKLAAQYGLLTQFNATVPEQRIQMVSVSENVLHRYFARSSVRIATAGGNAAGQPGGARKMLRWIAPIIDSQRVNDFLAAIQPKVSRNVEQWHSVAFRGWKRIVRAQSLVVTIIVAVSWFKLSFHALWFSLLMIWVVIYARKTVASMRYGFSDNALIYQSGWMVQHTTMVPISKIQSVELRENPLDRRTKMATVAIDLAGLDMNRHHISIKYLERDVAEKLINTLYDKVSATVYRWK